MLFMLVSVVEVIVILGRLSVVILGAKDQPTLLKSFGLAGPGSNLYLTDNMDPQIARLTK